MDRKVESGGWSLEGELIDFLAHTPFGVEVSRWDVRDWILEARACDVSEEEVKAVISAFEAEHGCVFPEGSLSESISSLSVGQMATRVALQGQGISPYGPISKLDEILALSDPANSN